MTAGHGTSLEALDFERGLFLEIVADPNHLYWMVRWGATTKEDVEALLRDHEDEVFESFASWSQALHRASIKSLWGHV